MPFASGQVFHHIRLMATETITCECGAVYEKGSVKLPARDRDYYDCRICGSRLDEWSSSRIPTFKLIERPDHR